MGQYGPIPKRSDQLIRRNIPEVPVDKLAALGVVRTPDLEFDDPHPIVVDFYQSLLESAQTKYYEPSDWQYARLALHFADRLLKSNTPNGQILATVTSMLSELLVSEGSRRRVRLEIERNQDKGGDVVEVADLFRSRLKHG